ncbi:MAG TPA: DUF2306 domain-containing protein [Rhizomicrobium sp.]|jgi:uncharacterized membrane protein|nr:DUF2306 domain-containing protein [Rhizomicrobium sp.]
MKLDDISFLGWIHTVPSIAAILLGAVILASRKGTARHRLLGDIYFFIMLLVSLSALPIFKVDLAAVKSGAFGFFHWLTIFTLIVIAAGYYTAPRQQHLLAAYLHPTCMITSYYLLIAATINELFSRIGVLHRLAIGGRHTSLVTATPLVIETHTVLMLALLVMLGFVMMQVARRRAITESSGL